MNPLAEDLFPEVKPPTEDEMAGLPADVKEAMMVLSGQKPLESLEDPGGVMSGFNIAPQSHPGNPGPQSLMEKWQAGLMKKHEVEKAQIENYDYEVFVFDLSIEDDAAKMANVFNRVATAGSVYQIEQTPVKVIGDSKAPRGFRAITSVKIWKIRKAVPKGLDAPIFTPLSK